MEKKQMYADGKAFEPQIDLSGYVEKEPGKGLSEHDFSAAHKEKLDSVEEGAQRNTVTGIKGDAEEAYRTGNINLTKENIGLGNVEDKSSRQIREEITKEDVEVSLGYTPEIAGAYQNATAYTDLKIAELIGGAPETLDTLKEVADAIRENKTVADALDAAIGQKANQTELDTHTGNSNIHITTAEREKWNATAEKIETVTGITDSPEVSDSHILASSKAVHQVFQSVSNGKSLIASAITDRGIVTPQDAAFQTMADNIRNLSKPTGNAGAAQVLAGYTFSNALGTGFTGTMRNCGAVSQALNAGGSYVIPAGYHDGSGRVSANSLASQTPATAAAGNITAGKTAWVNGVKVTGTGADNTANYNAGVAAADNRANPASVNYKTGYNAGYAAGQTKPSGLSVDVNVNLNAGANDSYTIVCPQKYLNGALFVYSHYGAVTGATFLIKNGVITLINTGNYNNKIALAYSGNNLVLTIYYIDVVKIMGFLGN